MEKRLMWDDGIEDNFYSMYRNRPIATEKIDKELDRIFKKEDVFLGFRRLKRKLNEKIDKFSGKLALYLIRNIMLREMQNDYYQNASHVREFIDIDSRMVCHEDGSCYRHVENLCIWQNGFYQFNSFNFTTSSMRCVKSNNFNEEISRELEELHLGGKLVPIADKEKGTANDYAKLESKILLMSKKHESYTE